MEPTAAASAVTLTSARHRSDGRIST